VTVIELDVEIPDLAEVEVETPDTEITPSGGATVVLVATPGPPGPQGPPGEGGFTYTPSSPAATWTITNTLGRKPASVTVWINDELVDTTIETPDVNTIVITFASPQSGRVEII
jgi:hypothetical protein